MKLGETKFGFRVRRVQAVDELKATLYELAYEKNGARLLWLDRKDENMTFGIGFKTPPRDDTGVFHIIEHSVLCGSEKYPVKDPFVVLLKSSMQTFLNALTYPDKTVYPISSRNRQDFLNLMDVYLDAVLHPLSAKDPHAFLQEGWHYELSEDGELTRNGVVYSEMKGSFANPDTVLSRALEHALFPDTCYGYVSGGDPEHIPELTYESYVEHYRRCYHPSNSYIFLDGSIDVDAVLSKLDSFLCTFDAIEPNTEIKMQPPITPERAVGSYEISEEEAKLDRVLLSEGFVYGTYEDVRLHLACDVLADVLTGTNDAPLKKALLEQGLCEDVEVDNTAELQQSFISITLRNTSEEKAEKAWQTVLQTIRDLCSEGLNKNHLNAAIDHLEFIQRERDSGRTPLGLIFGLNAMEAWLYGGDPVKKLEFASDFAALRQMVEDGGFEQLLQDIFLGNAHHAGVLLLPDAQLGKKRQEKEKAALAELLSGWTEEEKTSVRAAFAQLRQKQETPDTPEQLATVPKLSLRDIPEQLQYTEAEERTLDSHRVIYAEKNTGGISYLTLHFSLCDLTIEEISQADFLCAVLGELATDRYTPAQLFAKIQSVTGHLSCRLSVCSPNGKEDCDPYLEVSIAVLEEKKDAALELLGELLCRSRFDDTKNIFNVLRQEATDAEQELLTSGNSMALQHAIAGVTAGGAVADAYDGIEGLRWLQRARDRFDGQAEDFCVSLEALCKKIFIRERITFSLTGSYDADWMRRAAAVFPSGTVGEKTCFRPAVIPSTGIQIPAQIGFAAKAFDLGEDARGSARAAAKILSLDHLWNEVRVKGGAYGVGFGVRLSGVTLFSTYRDPDPAGALAAYEASGKALRSFCDTKEPLDDYIISSLSALSPLLSPRAEAQQSISNRMNGITKEQLQQQYSELLHTERDDLRTFSELLDEKQKTGVLCVIGGQAVLDACGELLSRRELLQGDPAAV